MTSHCGVYCDYCTLTKPYPNCLFIPRLLYTYCIRLNWLKNVGQVRSSPQLMSVILLLPTSGIAWLCCDARRQVRMQALTYLQRALLVHDLQTLDAAEWESCFNKVRKEMRNYVVLLSFFGGGKTKYLLRESSS